jgi:hypothetical protein
MVPGRVTRRHRRWKELRIPWPRSWTTSRRWPRLGLSFFVAFPFGIRIIALPVVFAAPAVLTLVGGLIIAPVAMLAGWLTRPLSADLTDEQLDAVPPGSRIRFSDGQRTVEQVVTSMLKHQSHQIEALKAAVG